VPQPGLALPAALLYHHHAEVLWILYRLPATLSGARYGLDCRHEAAKIGATWDVDTESESNASNPRIGMASGPSAISGARGTSPSSRGPAVVEYAMWQDSRDIWAR
jgi:hypothetical protein